MFDNAHSFGFLSHSLNVVLFIVSKIVLLIQLCNDDETCISIKKEE